MGGDFAINRPNPRKELMLKDSTASSGVPKAPEPTDAPLIEPEPTSEVTEYPVLSDTESSENKQCADALDDIKKELCDSDENGIIEKEIQYENGKISSEYLYNNLTGKKKAHIEYLEDGSINYKINFKYDIFGRPKKEIMQDADGTITYTTKYKYNLNGTADEIIKSHDGKHDWTHHYDKNGIETQRTFSTINSDGNREVTTWDYINDTQVTQVFDPEGNLIE